MRSRRLEGIVWGSALVLALGSGAARANLLVNGGLESAIVPTVPPNLVYVSAAMNSTALTGWTILSGTIDIVPNTYWQNTQGTYSVDMVGTPGIGSISQRITGLTSGLSYTLTFDFAANPEKPFYVDETGTTKILEVKALGNDGITNLTAPADYSLTDGTRTLANMQYTHQSYTFTANGTAATLVLSALTPGNLPGSLTGATAYTGPVIDNLDLETSGSTAPGVPEPASLAVLGMGGLLLLRRRARGVR